MRMIRFIGRDQSEVIEKPHCAKRTFFVWASNSQGLGSRFCGTAGCGKMHRLGTTAVELRILSVIPTRNPNLQGAHTDEITIRSKSMKWAL